MGSTLEIVGSVLSIIIAFFIIAKYMVSNLKKTFITGKRMDAKFAEVKITTDEFNELKFADKDKVTELVTKIDIYFNGGKKSGG